MKAPFSVQAINNEFEVLAVFLGIADDNDQERSQIKVLGMQDRIHKFQYNGELFAVARREMLTGVATAYEFNSNWYAVQKQRTSKPSEMAISVCFEDLKVDDVVIIWDRKHSAHGARGKIYWLEPETRMVSVVTKGSVDTWEGCADGLQKVVTRDLF